MRLFKKKDKRYYNYFDNYTNKVKGTASLGFVYVVIGVVAYLIYTYLL
jgi:hypothetical protein